MSLPPNNLSIRKIIWWQAQKTKIKKTQGLMFSSLFGLYKGRWKAAFSKSIEKVSNPEIKTGIRWSN
jgi:hypothetical protein